MSSAESQRTFFRQSGWMMLSTTACGVFMFAVHPFYGPWMSGDEFGLFVTLLQVLNVLMIPVLAMQAVFGQQAASALTDPQSRALRGTARSVLLFIAGLWGGLVLVFALFQGIWLNWLQIENAPPIWMTLFAVLPALVLPVFLGILQGRQNFFWFGCSVFSNGLVRFIAIGILVIGISRTALGAMTGVFLGVSLSLLLAAYHCRADWRGPRLPCDWQPLLKRILPLTVGLGASQFMLAADMMVVRAKFPPEFTGPYGGAGMIGRGLVIFTAPLIWVMFPKLVRATALATPSRVHWQTFWLTLALGSTVALSLTLVSWLSPVLLDSATRHVEIARLPLISALLEKRQNIDLIMELIPRFLWAMLPLALANVFINQLLAQGRYRAVPYLAMVAIAYFIMLSFFARSAQQVLIMLGTFSTILLLISFSFARAADRVDPRL